MATSRRLGGPRDLPLTLLFRKSEAQGSALGLQEVDWIDGSRLRRFGYRPSALKRMRPPMTADGVAPIHLIFLFGDGDGWRSVAATGKTSGGETWDLCAWTLTDTPVELQRTGKERPWTKHWVKHCQRK